MACAVNAFWRILRPAMFCSIADAGSRRYEPATKGVSFIWMSKQAAQEVKRERHRKGNCF